MKTIQQSCIILMSVNISSKDLKHFMIFFKARNLYLVKFKIGGIGLKVKIGGALHIHMILWIKEGTIPDNVIVAELPRGDDEDSQHLRENWYKNFKFTHADQIGAFIQQVVK